MTIKSFDLAALAQAFQAGATASDIVDSIFARIAAVADPGIFILLRDKSAILADYALLGDFDPADKPLWGVPFVIRLEEGYDFCLF